MIAPAGRRRPPVPTVVFDEYWRFACERQRVYYRRLAGQSPPWTNDPILGRHRFTNAYRASDRVSQYLIQDVQYVSSQSIADAVLRTLLFKFFNKIETWELIVDATGLPEARQFRVAEIGRLLDHALESGTRVYSAAYIIPSPAIFGSPRKHRNHLNLLDHMLRDGLVDRLEACRSLKDMYIVLRSYPSIGDFLGFQFAIDLNYTEAFDFSEMEFVVPGPGAREGIAKCFSNLGDFDESEVIRWTAETQGEHLARLDLDFPSLWGRPLQLIDIQNLFCEIGKYARLSHPEFTSEGGRGRIKQRYAPSGFRPHAWFPPKWGINEHITPSDSLSAASRSGVDGIQGAFQQVRSKAPAAIVADESKCSSSRQDSLLPLVF